MAKTTNNEIYFETLEELRTQAIKDKACHKGLEWLDKQKNLKEVFENISLTNRLWCLCRGYIQFSDHCDWNKLGGIDWAQLLSCQSRFGNKCNWEKLDGSDWPWLLIEQPQFSCYCDWNKLNGFHWSWLLCKQPQFYEFCDWNKLSDSNWSLLLHKQPQFEKYKI